MASCMPLYSWLSAEKDNTDYQDDPEGSDDAHNSRFRLTGKTTVEPVVKPNDGDRRDYPPKSK
jgi:hypothetical protein